MSAAEITEMNLAIREGTTRNISITCKSKETGNNFDFSGYTVQTYLEFGINRGYVENTIVENIVNYKIPATISVGEKSGVAETRIYKNGDVYEVLRINITVLKAVKPDTAPLAQ